MPINISFYPLKVSLRDKFTNQMHRKLLVLGERERERSFVLQENLALNAWGIS